MKLHISAVAVHTNGPLWKKSANDSSWQDRIIQQLLWKTGDGDPQGGGGPRSSSLGWMEPKSFRTLIFILLTANVEDFIAIFWEKTQDFQPGIIPSSDRWNIPDYWSGGPGWGPQCKRSNPGCVRLRGCITHDHTPITAKSILSVKGYQKNYPGRSRLDWRMTREQPRCNPVGLLGQRTHVIVFAPIYTPFTPYEGYKWV